MQLPVVKKTCRVEKEEGSEGNSGTAVRDPGFDSKCSHALEYILNHEHAYRKI